MEDVKITLKLNKDIIMKTLMNLDSSYNYSNKSKIFEIEKENSNLHMRISQLFDERRETEKKVSRINNEIQRRKIQDEEKFKISNNNYTSLKKKIAEKENEIVRLKKEIEKLISFKEINFIKNVFVANPTKKNLENYLELIYTREITDKLNQNIENDKILNEKIKGDLNALQNELENYKKANGILIESPEEKENSIYDTYNPFLDQPVIKDEMIDVSRYNSIIKEKGLSNDDDDNFEDEIYFPDKVFMKKVEDHSVVSKLNLSFIKEKSKYNNNIKVIPKNNDAFKLKMKPKEIKKPLEENKEKNDLNKKINEYEIKLSQVDDKILDANQKILKFTNSNKELNTKIKILMDNIKFADSKINTLINHNEQITKFRIYDESEDFSENKEEYYVNTESYYDSDGS